MGIFGGIGKAIKGLGKLVGKAAPLAGLIPGVGPGLAAGLGGLGALAGGKNVLKGAAGGFIGSKLGGVGGILGKLKAPGVLGNASGQFDLQKVLGAGGAGLQFLGRQRQRKADERYLNQQNEQRQDLMSKVLTAPSYNFNPTS